MGIKEKGAEGGIEVEYLFRSLMGIVARLRSPEGCPWDRRQTIPDAARYLVEETYEVLDAVENGDSDGLKEELGDLLFQILFISRLAEEEKKFDMASVIKAVSEKMVRRHPHVFGDKKVLSVEDVKRNWDDIKRHVENKESGQRSCIDGIPLSMPALMRAQKIAEKAARVGFDWEDVRGVLQKVDEETEELKRAIAAGSREQVEEELGDLLFVLVNLGRFSGVDAEAALRASIRKFEGRFSFIERKLASKGRSPAEASLAEMDALWNEAKKSDE